MCPQHPKPFAFKVTSGSKVTIYVISGVVVTRMLEKEKAERAVNVSIVFKRNEKTTFSLTFSDLQPLSSNSFKSFAATPYVLFSLQLLILRGLLFLKSRSIAPFSVCTYRFRLLPLGADSTQPWRVAAL